MNIVEKKLFDYLAHRLTIQAADSTCVIQSHFRLIFSWCFSTASLLGASRRQKHKSDCSIIEYA